MKKLFLLLLLLPVVAQAEVRSRKYATAATIQFELRDAEGAVAGKILEASAVCAQGGGANDDDVQIIKDGAAAADSTNCFASEGLGVYSLVLTSGEMTAARVSIVIDDQTGTDVWLPKVVNIDTYGDASATHTIPDVNVAALTDDIITASDIAADAIGASEIAASAIGASEIATDAIGAAEIAAAAIVKDTEATGWNDLSAAAVNGEMVDVMATDTHTELTSCPAATTTYDVMLRYAYMLARNKITEASGVQTLFRDDGSTNLCTWTTNDNGVTFTRGEGS